MHHFANASPTLPRIRHFFSPASSLPAAGKYILSGLEGIRCQKAMFYDEQPLAEPTQMPLTTTPAADHDACVCGLIRYEREQITYMRVSSSTQPCSE